MNITDFSTDELKKELLRRKNNKKIKFPYHLREYPLYEDGFTLRRVAEGNLGFDKNDERLDTFVAAMSETLINVTVNKDGTVLKELVK